MRALVTSEILAATVGPSLGADASICNDNLGNGADREERRCGQSKINVDKGDDGRVARHSTNRAVARTRSTCKLVVVAMVTATK